METIKKTTSFLEVLVFEPEAEKITDALAITEERADQLMEILYNVVKTNKEKENPKITDDLHAISVKVKHVNELSFLVFNYGKFMGEQLAEKKAGMGSSMILDLLKGFNPGLPPIDSSDEEPTEDN